MLLNTLSFFAIFFIIVFTPQSEGAEDSVNILSADISNFDCEKLTEYDRLPDGWDWTKVGDKLDSEKCFENIASNLYFCNSLDHARQLFEVARNHFEDLAKKGFFCPLAREIASYALGKDLAILEACGADKYHYPVPVIATIFKNAEYKLTDIDYKRVNWDDIADPSDIDRETKQRLWLALVAVLHERLDDGDKEMMKLARFFGYITDHHGIDLGPSTPLTELDTQIIRLLPVAIEYILSRVEAKRSMDFYIAKVMNLYKALHGKIASNQALSLYFHSRFFLNPAVDLQSELSRWKLELPPINDTQMTKEVFAYGNNLSGISDPVERELATTARQQLEALLFHPPKE